MIYSESHLQVAGGTEASLLLIEDMLKDHMMSCDANVISYNMYTFLVLNTAADVLKMWLIISLFLFDEESIFQYVLHFGRLYSVNKENLSQTKQYTVLYHVLHDKSSVLYGIFSDETQDHPELVE